MRRASFPLLFLLFFPAIAVLGQTPGAGTVTVSATDKSNVPLAGVSLQLKQGDNVVATATTDLTGHAEFPKLPPGTYEIVAQMEGFEKLDKAGLKLAASGTIAVEFTLIPALVQSESIEVHESAIPIEQQGATIPTELPAPEQMEELPTRPATVSDALPLVPGVVRAPDGGLRISGGSEHHSSLVVNSADVTDPATGQFGLTVPMDSVESVNVFQTPFLAEYGRFSNGLVSVETRRGSEQWKWELNDPFPDFFIRSWHLDGLRDASPRLNFGGPIIPGKLYFSEGVEYTVRKTPVFTLPFPNNETREHGVNSFSQLDWVVSDRQLVTATLHVAPQDTEFANINFFNPQETSPNTSTRNYTATIADRLTLADGLFENTLSLTRFDARVWGQGSQDLTLAPTGNTGNYFEQQQRTASRVGLSSTYSFAPVNAGGAHNFKVGSYLAGSSDQGQVTENPINLTDANGNLVQRITFTGGLPYQLSDMEFAFFGQDHWMVSPTLAFDYGLRAESQQVSGAIRLAPRVGVAWSPPGAGAMVIRGGFGLFYDRVPLNVYAFNHYPNQVVTTYGPDGQITSGPITYQNILGEVANRTPFVFQETTAGNFSPRSSIWNVEVEEPLTSFLKLKAGYLQNDGSGLIIVNPIAPAPGTNLGAYSLTGTGRSRYQQFELTARLRINDKRELNFSYVRSRSKGDLNDFNNYLGSLPVPIVRNDVYSYLPADLPNRFLTWGRIELPNGFGVSPMVEYRSGFPYLTTDVFQNYAGIPDLTRFPNFFSLDSRFWKDIKVNPKYTVRFSVSTYNLTDHYNPEAVHSNIADPLYGTFFGQRGRHFTADFDVIF